MTDTLRKKALKATNGPLGVRKREMPLWTGVGFPMTGRDFNMLAEFLRDEDAEYFAAANPTAILSLLDKYDAALAEIATLREALTSARTELFAEFGTTDDFVDTVVAKIDAALTSETPA